MPVRLEGVGGASIISDVGVALLVVLTSWDMYFSENRSRREASIGRYCCPPVHPNLDEIISDARIHYPGEAQRSSQAKHQFGSCSRKSLTPGTTYGRILR